jgi:hypothetical protein
MREGMSDAEWNQCQLDITNEIKRTSPDEECLAYLLSVLRVCFASAQATAPPVWSSSHPPVPVLSLSAQYTPVKSGSGRGIRSFCPAAPPIPTANRFQALTKPSSVV